MSSLLNKVMEDNKILKVTTVESNSLLNDECYNELKTNACIAGAAIANEIDEYGNLVFKGLCRCVRDCDIEKFSEGDVTAYHYERRGMSAFIMSGGINAELIINPTYYKDDRFEKLLEKNEVNMYCELIDCSRNKIMAVRNITIEGKCLDYLKSGLKMNAQYTRDEYSQWIAQVLYSNSMNKNVKLATRLGKCRDSKEYVTVLV